MRGIVLLAILSLSILAEEAKLSFKPLLGIRMHSEKRIYDDGSGKNLDTWYNRFNFGGTATQGDFEVKAYVSVYPENYGKTVDGKQIGKTDITEAIIIHKGKHVRFEAGRNLIYNTDGLWGGNYIDEGLGGYFAGKGIITDLVNVVKEIGITKTSVMVETTDPNVNKANLRIWQDIIATESLRFGWGYKANLFDLGYDSDAELNHTVAMNSSYTFATKQKVFIETAIKNITSDTTDNDGDIYVPIFFGASTPVPMIVDMIQVEAEFVSADVRKRLTTTKTSPGIEDTPVQWAIYSKKAVTDNITLSFGLQADKKASEPLLAFRLEAGI